ncbi:PAS domain-containing protein (plasmid) [Mesorhizobium sp. AR02]|uniref:sensor histidine kinase n=1 Tax=unclassified Mesorhizobium TaxID=325217 RepID=UPI002160737F|nr:MULTISPECIES: HWE histidine kinase domain-containing protein [unclassified Mesorhizobium]UVK41996.1 PAS domain-containing protein [Mesorhizobium sp. AR07]UVK57442.1 PAS domain-containing protein [Mesorhizobium sp. AR02]
MTTTAENLKPLLWEPKNLVRAIEAAGVALWSWNVDSDALAMDDRAYDLWGIPRTTDVKFEDLSAHIHPADRDRVRAAFNATRAIVGPYEIDFRMMIGDELKWISARGQGDDEGIVQRLMFGIFIDVTGRKQAEESRELLAGEMSHRVKNLLTIASGLTAITSRSTNTTNDMARELTQRLTALGRAHDLVRPVPGQTEAASALLGDLLTVLLAPYDDLGAFSGRIRVSVPRMSVGESSATILALIIHELATNSLKYGALSAEAGTLDVSCSAHDDAVTIVWTESGGPLVETPAGPPGYGSRLVERSVTGHLRGSIAYDWSKQGLVVTLKVQPERLAQ